MSEKLEPCPFCGGEGGTSRAVGEWWTRCLTCEASTVLTSTEERAIAAWNRRAARAEARPAVDREAVARIISGAPFPSAKSFAKADDILALLSPATSPGEGSSGAESAARIASDHAASETLRKSEEG